MANLRTAMDAAFWDLDIATPESLNGVARSIPGEPIPLDATRAGRLLRVQQLSLLGLGFPWGVIPSWFPTPHKELGSFALQSCMLKATLSNWWLGLIGQVRPKKLISSLATELSCIDNWEMPDLKNVARQFLDRSLYSVGLCTQLALTSSCSIFYSDEEHGDRKGRRSRAMLFQKFPSHDITLEAAWPELFIDCNGRYWEVPESISLNCLSVVSESGLRYRFGIHKNAGLPRAASNSVSKAPHALQPGLFAKAAVSYEKSKYLWRQKEKKEDIIVEETPKGKRPRPSYDIRLKEPHAAISGIIGATSESWFGRGRSRLTTESGEAGNGGIPLEAKRGWPSVDLFSSVCYTFQHGSFRNFFGDLTRVDARLDVASASASALGKRIANIFLKASDSDGKDTRSSPKLNFIFQQQLVGPVVFRLDSRLFLDSTDGKCCPQLEDMIFSLNYSLRYLQSGKVLAWYSPKRKEGMIELRLFEY